MQSVLFEVGKNKLVGTLFLSPYSKSRTVFLMVHGWQSGQDRGFGLAKSLLEKGYSSMTFDLRGHGQSEGNIEEFSRKDFLDDVLAAYDQLIRHVGKEVDVVAIGSSFGGYLISLLSAQRKIHSLILRAPANFQDAHFSDSFIATHSASDAEIWELQMHLWNEAESLRAIHAFEGKVLIVESEKDEIIPQLVLLSYANAIINSDLLTYEVILNAPHSITKFPLLQEKYKDIVFKWLGY